MQIINMHNISKFGNDRPAFTLFLHPGTPRTSQVSWTGSAMTRLTQSSCTWPQPTMPWNILGHWHGVNNRTGAALNQTKVTVFAKRHWQIYSKPWSFAVLGLVTLLSQLLLPRKWIWESTHTIKWLHGEFLCLSSNPFIYTAIKRLYN